MQRRLTTAEIAVCDQAAKAISRVSWPDGESAPIDYVRSLFCRMAYNATSDGKPWVEPEKPIEKGEWVALWDNETPRVWSVGRYLGDIGENEGGFRHGLIGRYYLWQNVRRATPDEIARAEAAE